MRQQAQFFSTHQDDVERRPVSVMQSKDFAGTSLDAVSGHRRANVLFGENETKASGARLCWTGQKQQLGASRFDGYLIKDGTEIPGR